MPKKSSLITFSIFLIINLAFAEESITITTYYPSPYGSYNELTTNALVLNPLNEPPSDSTKEGALYYDASKHNFNYYNGSDWAGFVRVQKGTLTVTDAGVYTVLFKTPFSDKPLINFPDFPLSSGVLLKKVSDVSKSGFKIEIERLKGNETAVIKWKAFGD